MAFRRNLKFAGAISLALIASRGLPAATFSELAKFLPNDANAVVVVNAASLYASPAGQRAGWKEKYADRFEAQPLILPPSAEHCVLAAAIDLHTLRPQWQAAAMELSIDPSPGDIARRRGGRNDVLAGKEVTWLGNQLCVLKFAPRIFGVITPANRQQAARWATDVKAGSTGALAPYLRQSLSYADTAGTEVILAVDLVNAFNEASLRAAAAQSDALKGVSADEAASVLASIQGVKLGVKVGETLTGRLQLDFTNDAKVLAPVAKPLILKIVAKAGATLPEFAEWNPEAGPKSIALQGTLTEDGMRRIFSLLALDATLLDSKEPEQATSTTESADAAKKALAQASLRYFGGISKYIDDLDRLQRAASLDQAVMWIENYARKVDALPTRGVDPELVQYGKYVADTFRAIVDEASGLADQADAAAQPVVSNYKIGYLPTGRTVNYGGNFQRMYAPYGYADVDAQATEKNIQKTQDQIYEAVKKAQQTLAQLVTDQQTVRKKLTEKFGIPF